DLFPGLWASRDLHEIEVGQLTSRASTALAREVLGADVDEETLERISLRAEGNAFYLEELIRAVASGKGDALPGTVLAMAQARLESMEPEARRVLRAGSVFGQTFWSGAVTALLGGERRSEDVEEWLLTLAEREVIQRQRESRFRGEVEYTFRQGLVRDAAYAALTDQDSVLGHRLAAEWLLAKGETEAAPLAEHFEKGQVEDFAVLWWTRAAAQAIERGDPESALRCAD